MQEQVILSEAKDLITFKVPHPALRRGSGMTLRVGFLVCRLEMTLRNSLPLRERTKGRRICIQGGQAGEHIRNLEGYQ